MDSQVRPNTSPACRGWAQQRKGLRQDPIAGLRVPTITDAMRVLTSGHFVVAGQLRGRLRRGRKRLELLSREGGLVRFGQFRAGSNERLCSRTKFGVYADNTRWLFAGTFTGATGLEPATSGVTGRYVLNRHSRPPPGFTRQSRQFVAARTGYYRLRPGTTRQGLCSTRVVGSSGSAA